MRTDGQIKECSGRFAPKTLLTLSTDLDDAAIANAFRESAKSLKGSQATGHTHTH